MSWTALDLSAKALERYHPSSAARRRRILSGSLLSKRRRRASLTAHKAAELLRTEFGAKEILVFGSLARRKGFTPWSDIDIAARGIPALRFFEAVGAVTGLSAEFKIDLVDLETCTSSMKEMIETEGKAL